MPPDKAAPLQTPKRFYQRIKAYSLPLSGSLNLMVSSISSRPPFINATSYWQWCHGLLSIDMVSKCILEKTLAALYQVLMIFLCAFQCSQVWMRLTNTRLRNHTQQSCSMLLNKCLKFRALVIHAELIQATSHAPSYAVKRPPIVSTFTFRLVLILKFKKLWDNQTFDAAILRK